MSLYVNQLSDKQIALNKISIQIVTFWKIEIFTFK